MSRTTHAECDSCNWQSTVNEGMFEPGETPCPVCSDGTLVEP